MLEVNPVAWPTELCRVLNRVGELPRYVTILSLAATAAGCGCVPVSDNLWLGPRPPANASASNIEECLQQKANRPVDGFSSAIGLITTVFKRLGILGWRDMAFSVTAEGPLANAPVYSTDGFLTLDLRISKLEVSGTLRPLPDHRFIRAEVCVPALGIQSSSFPIAGDRVRVSGPILWDGDGFFEIHPTTAEGVQIIPD